MRNAPTQNLEFFELLYGDAEFSSAMGRVTLAGGRLEATLTAFLHLNGVVLPMGSNTLGAIISALEGSGFISASGAKVLRSIKLQRNYLTHNLFALFAGQIPETLLRRTDLVRLDVEAFTEKALVLEENLVGLSLIVERRVAELLDPSAPAGPRNGMLFRP